MQSRKLKLYHTGNFEQYAQIRSKLEENQMKQYSWDASMKEYIARFGHESDKLARQAQSKERTLGKMERGGLTEKGARYEDDDPRRPQVQDRWMEKARPRCLCADAASSRFSCTSTC